MQSDNFGLVILASSMKAQTEMYKTVLYKQLEKCYSKYWYFQMWISISRDSSIRRHPIFDRP